MAKINLEFDTEDKSYSVTKNGKKLKDVTSLSFYKDNENGAYINIWMQSEAEDGMKHSQSLYCSKNSLVETKINHQDILNFFKNCN